MRSLRAARSNAVKSQVGTFRAQYAFERVQIWNARGPNSIFSQFFPHGWVGARFPREQPRARPWGASQSILPNMEVCFDYLITSRGGGNSLTHLYFLFQVLCILYKKNILYKTTHQHKSKGGGILRLFFTLFSKYFYLKQRFLI